MKPSNPRQLKDLIKNMAKSNNQVASIVLQNFMLERLLERISVSNHREKFILKGGFLIASMVGIDMRSTMDMDTTVKDLSLSLETIKEVLDEILSIDLNDQVTFQIKNIGSIHDVNAYDNFRVSLLGQFFTINVNLKIDITTGDVIIPGEVEYSYKLMFEERCIPIKAYNLHTILAEKIEAILARNVVNTRARDYYDIYILMTLRRKDFDPESLKNALEEKVRERNTRIYLENKEKYLNDIATSEDLQKVWNHYSDKYPYARGIHFTDILEILWEILEQV